MTLVRRLAAPTIVGLAVVVIGLRLNAMFFGPEPDDGGEARGLEILAIDLATGPREAILSAHNMVPGDVVTVAITLTNSGPRPMTYAMTRGLVSAGGAALTAALALTIRTIGSSCRDFDGTIVFDGRLGEAAIGSEGTGRPLPAATAEILCFRTALPLDAGNGFQGAATTVTLSFGANVQAAIP
jgi:hypothetical protein